MNVPLSASMFFYSYRVSNLPMFTPSGPLIPFTMLLHHHVANHNLADEPKKQAL